METIQNSHQKVKQKVFPPVFSQYWQARAINPAMIPASVKGTYIEYFSQLNGHQERFQWSKSCDHETVNQKTGIKTSHKAWKRLSFSGSTCHDIPLFVAPACQYERFSWVYVTEGLSDGFSILTAGHPVIALKAKGSLSLAEQEISTFLEKFPNITEFRVIPDPDGWDDWTGSHVWRQFSVQTRFFNIVQALSVAGVTGKDVNDLWKAVRDAEKFFQVLHEAEVQITLPTEAPVIVPHQPSKPQTDSDLQHLLAEIEALYSGERMADYAFAHAPKPSSGLKNAGEEIEVRSNGGFYVKPSTRSWRMYGANAGGIGIVTLASYLMYGANSVQGEQFSAMLKEIAWFVGYALPEKASQKRHKHADATTVKTPVYSPQSTIEYRDGLPCLKHYECTEFGDKERFLDQYESVLRYNKTSEKWMLFDGARWITDGKELTAEMADRLILAMVQDSHAVESALAASFLESSQQEYITPKHRQKRTKIELKQSSKLSQLAGQIDPLVTYANDVNSYAYELRKTLNKSTYLMRKNAAHSPRVATEQPEYDRDPFLLNLTNGTLNLNTGEFRQHRPSDLLSKVMGTHFDRTATCPAFDDGLVLMFQGDSDMIDYILRLIAFSLPGNADEKVLPFCYGPEGDNAKSTFMLLLKMLLNDYYGEIPMESLLTGKQNPNGPDENLAGLQGKRFVTAPESNNLRLNGSKVKLLTGGDPITTRVLHGHNMTFDPSHTLWIIGNKKPQVDADDPAIWLRLKLIEFCVIPKNKQKKRADVLAAYRKELPGILNKILAAGTRAKQEGLTSQDAPKKVIDATAGYRQDSDSLGEFLDASCLIGTGLQESSTALAKAYKTWCLENDDPFHKNQFYEAMQKRGFRRESGGANKLYFSGIQLKTECRFA
jgi:P4 family phage/plasmid primase-like protien